MQDAWVSAGQHRLRSNPRSDRSTADVSLEADATEGAFASEAVPPSPWLGRRPAGMPETQRALRVTSGSCHGFGGSEAASRYSGSPRSSAALVIGVPRSAGTSRTRAEPPLTNQSSADVAPRTVSTGRHAPQVPPMDTALPGWWSRPRAANSSFQGRATIAIEGGLPHLDVAERRVTRLTFDVREALRL